MSMRIAGILSLFAGVAVSMAVAEPLLTVLPAGPDGGGIEQPPRLLWSTDPGIRYALQESTNMVQWSPVAGYPTEAAALAQQHALDLVSGTSRFYRVQRLDEQPPALTQRVPADNTFGVPRFSTMTIDLDDFTGIDLGSIRLSVGAHGPFSLADTQLTINSNRLTFTLGGDTALGGYGEMVAVSLVVGDTVGNLATNRWSFELEKSISTAADMFIFGSPQAQRAGQRLNGPAATLAARFGGPVRMADSDKDWRIQTVTATNIVVVYTNSTAPVFAAGQLVANLAPSHVSEIFYRRIDAVTDNPGVKMLTLQTTEVTLPDFIVSGSFSNPGDAVFLEFDGSGNLIRALKFDETFNLPTIGTDLSGTTLFQTDGLTLTLPEGCFEFRSRLKVAMETSGARIERFEASASGDLDIACVPRLQMSGAYSDEWDRELWSWNHWIWFAVGVVPVGIELEASITANATVDVSASADMRVGFRQYGSMRVAATYVRTNNPSTTWDRWLDIDPTETVPFTYTLNGEGRATVSLVPQIDVRVYGAAGIYLNTDPRLELSGAVTMVDGIVTEADWLLGAYADVNAGLSIIGFETGELPSLPPFRLFTKEWSDHYESAPPPTVPTSITRQPLSQTAKAGDTVTFSVDAAGSGTLTYQWYQNGEVLQGETAKDLTLRNVASGHTGSYYVRVNGSGGATNSSVATLSITAGGSTGPGSTYLVIDLSAGPSATSYPVSYLSSVPSGGWSDVYKTTKLVMRRIPAGTFTMGSPSGELGRYDNETQHQVTLSKDFYIGVFEVTQKQWERVMGTWPSYFNNTSYRDSRPVEQVSYYDIRENPANSAISPNW
ncbi:MAG: hypothetical protein FJ280_18660, partial [Planctomycetes bacterium]|nr:hypothetical protein [Planctomycetota bacterium]